MSHKFTDKWGKDTAKARYGTGKEYSPPKDESQPQDPVDQHGPDYKNDASGWVRGQGKDPHFKRGP